MRNKIIYLAMFFILIISNTITPVKVIAQGIENINSEQTDSSSTSLDDSIEYSDTSSSEISNNINEKVKEDTVTDIQTREQTVRDVAPNVITNMYITDNTGNPLDNTLGAWDSFRIYGDFIVPNNQVKAGDTTTIQLPDKITFYTTENFEVKDSGENIVAHAVIDPSTKTVVLTYTDFVEKNSDISGSFYFYARVDTTVVKEKEKITVEIGVDGKTIIAGDIEYDGPSEKNDDPLLKYGWMDKDDPHSVWYYLAINYTKKAYPDAIMSDSIKFK